MDKSAAGPAQNFKVLTLNTYENQSSISSCEVWCQQMGLSLGTTTFNVPPVPYSSFVYYPNLFPVSYIVN